MMGMFGEKTTSQQRSYAKEEEDRRRWVEAEDARREVAFAKAEPPFVAEREANLARCIEEHTEDAAAHKAEFTRMGDFLSVHVERLGVAAPSIIDADRRSIRPIAQDINVNLSLVTAIEKVDGKAPGHLEKIDWYFSNVLRDANGKWRGTGGGSEKDGWRLEATPAYYSTYGWPTHRRSSYVLPTPPQNSQSHYGMTMGGVRDQCKKFYTDDYPRAAEDDVIHFRGLGSTLSVPYGLGAAVLHRIMEAVKGS